MKNFDFRRFVQTLKCQMLMGRKYWLRQFLVFFLLLFGIQIFVLHVANMSAYHNVGVQYVTQFSMFFLAISILYGATSIFRVLKDTRSRVSYLMFPASNLEKYVSCWVQSTFVMAAIALVAYFCADTVRTLIDPVFGHEMTWGVPMFLDFLTSPFVDASKEGSQRWQEFLVACYAIVAVVLFCHAVYMLGGTVFRRNQFRLTCLVVFFVTIINSEVIYLLNLEGLISNNITLIKFDYVTGEMYVYPEFYVVFTTIYLLTAVTYWLSYRIFCRVQAVNNKWLNV